MGIWVEKWYWVATCSSSIPPCCLHMGQFWIRVREGMLQVYWLWVVGGLTTFPQFPPSLFNGFARVAHSLAIWPQPWHLKHCRALGSFACFGNCPMAPVSTWVLPLLWEAVATLTCSRRAASWRCSDPGQSDHCGSWGRQEYSCPSCPIPWPLFLGLLGAVAGQVPCSALVRVAINLVIWSPSSFEHVCHFSGSGWPCSNLFFGILHLTFHFSSCYHELGVGGLRVTV